MLSHSSPICSNYSLVYDAWSNAGQQPMAGAMVGGAFTVISVYKTALYIGYEASRLQNDPWRRRARTKLEY
jgi:hypothetical protein